MSLDELALKHDTDKSSRSHWYTRFYERMFGGIRENVESLLELGVGGGPSIRMWKDYFPNALIYGVDQNHVVGDFGGRVKLYECEQTDREALEAHFTGVQLEIIIDDCSHDQKKTVASMKILYPLLSDNGWYVIEDMDMGFIEPIKFGLEQGCREAHVFKDKCGCEIIFIRK